MNVTVMHGDDSVDLVGKAGETFRCWFKFVEEDGATLLAGLDLLAREADDPRAAEALDRAASHSGSTLDLRAEELRYACDALDELVGRFHPEDVLGEIFSRFCIGK